MIEQLDDSDDLLRLSAYADGWDNRVLMEAPDVADLGGALDTTADKVVVESCEYDAYGNTTIYDINSSVVIASQIENPSILTNTSLRSFAGSFPSSIVVCFALVTSSWMM